MRASHEVDRLSGRLNHCFSSCRYVISNQYFNYLERRRYVSVSDFNYTWFFEFRLRALRHLKRRRSSQRLTTVFAMLNFLPSKATVKPCILITHSRPYIN